MRWYIAFLAVFISLKAVSSDCYDEEAVLKINCSLNAECLNKQSIGQIYNLVAMSEGFFISGLDYNTVKEAIDLSYRNFKENFSMISTVSSIRYRCVRRGGKDFLIVGLDDKGQKILLNYIFRDGGVITGGKADQEDLSRYFLKHAWTVIN